jgi:chromate transporter
MMDTLNFREDVTLGALFLEFAKIGLCGIGSMLVWTRRVIVDERHWMSEAEFAETLSLGQFLPDPEIANISIYVGSKFRGPIGAIIALLGLTAAPLAVGLVLGTLYLRYPHPAVIQKVLGGISAAAACHLSGAKVSQTQLDQACGTNVKLDPGLTLNKPCP